MTLQRIMSCVRKACDDYGMISDGDRIAVGISGGKDSLTLLSALAAMRRFYPVKYELEAITVSLGFKDMDLTPVRELCHDIDVRYTVIETDIGEIIFDIREEKNPCSLCAKMRRGAINSEAKKLGCNKIALGHNKDDVIHTFFLSLFYEGRINTFAPVTYLDKTDLHCIRPLIYTPEADIRSFVKSNGIRIVKSPCKADGHTKRQEVRELLTLLHKSYKNLDNLAFGAIQRSSISGWHVEKDT